MVGQSKCSGHPEACPPTVSRIYPVPPGRKVEYMRDISIRVEDRG